MEKVKYFKKQCVSQGIAVQIIPIISLRNPISMKWRIAFDSKYNKQTTGRS